MNRKILAFLIGFILGFLVLRFTKCTDNSSVWVSIILNIVAGVILMVLDKLVFKESSNSKAEANADIIRMTFEVPTSAMKGGKATLTQYIEMTPTTLKRKKLKK